MEEQISTSPGKQGAALRYGIAVAAVIYILASLYFIVDMRGRIATLEASAKVQESSTQKIEQKLHMANKTLAETAEALGSKVGMTQEQLDRKTEELRRMQQANVKALTAEQQKQQQAIVGVSGEVNGVRTDLGGAKSDIASTRSDLEATKARLERTMGDLNIQSGLIAKNHDELDLLKHRGDRNYFEFTLKKNQRTPVGTISLQLKKSDAKKSRFTLNVLADDRTIEKKDRTANEPLQFYTGRDRSLYELVVFNVTKDHVSGYLSTPKNQ